MIEVTKAQFFAAIGGPENIHPRPERDHDSWRDQRTREVVGRTDPGYMNPRDRPRYFLAPEFAQRKGISA